MRALSSRTESAIGTGGVHDRSSNRDDEAAPGNGSGKACHHGVRQAGLRSGAGGLRRELRAPRGARRRMLRLPPRGKGRRPVGWHPEQVDRGAMGRGHDGARPLHDQGHGRPGDGARPLAGAPRSRRARERLLAGVRPEGQGADHRPATALAPGRAVRAGRATDEEPRRRSRPAGRGPGPSGAEVAARHAAGLSRDHPGLLPERAPAPGRSRSQDPGPVLPGRDRDAPGTRLLHPAAGGDPRLPAGAAPPAQAHGGHLLHDAAPARARGHEPAVALPPGAPRIGATGAGRSGLRAEPGGAVRGRRGDGARARQGLRRVRIRGKGARAARGDPRSARGARDPRPLAGSTTSA